MSRTARKRRERPDRLLRREPNGDLFDERRERKVTLDELRDDLRAGRRFRARRADGGDCTYALLAEVLTGREPGLAPVSTQPGPGGLLGRIVRDSLDWASDAPSDRGAARRTDRKRRHHGPPRPPG